MVPPGPDRLQVDDTITCVECGALAHRLTYPPEDGLWQPGEIVAYRCAGCGDRWDIELPPEDEVPDERW